jgi:hypothetical protein
MSDGGAATLSLVMILKNEAKSIRAVLEAALPHVDRATLLDTGSTDGTQDIIRETFATYPSVELQLVEEPFIDFAASRNRVLDLDTVRGPAFQLMLSGDEYLVGGTALEAHCDEWKDKLVDGKTVDIFRLRIAVRGVTLMTPRVFRAGSAWRYEGVVHEVPYNRTDDKALVGTITDAGIDHVESDPETRYANIWEVHVPLLKAALDKNENDERALMFLAQSYECLMPGFDEEERPQYAAEALELRKRRNDIPTGGKAERAYNQMHMIDDARMTGLFTEAELLAWAKKLLEVDEQRPETAMLVATLAMSVEPVQKVYEHAARAAKVAESARAIANETPVDTSIEWRAHNMAATACKQLAVKHGGDWWRIMKQHAEAGIAVCEALGYDHMKHVFYPFLAEAADHAEAS